MNDLYTVMNRYINYMGKMGFEAEESIQHYEIMRDLHPNSKPEEICWLIQKYAAQRITVLAGPHGEFSTKID